MILVDSSVWIDYLRGVPAPGTDTLDALLGTVPLAVSDLIVTEILQGCASDRELDTVRDVLCALTLVTLGGPDRTGPDAAAEAARDLRRLRAPGTTARRIVDRVIATRCILGVHERLHYDRDSDAFGKHLGLPCVGSVRWGCKGCVPDAARR